MITFIAAVYNEEDELDNLLNSVEPFVDAFRIADDGSTDKTSNILELWRQRDDVDFEYTYLRHIGLPETVKNEALKMVEDGSWVLMLDADEQLPVSTLENIWNWVNSLQSGSTDYVYFRQLEIINETIVREFQKCKLFRKEAITFPLNNIHADDIFTGEGSYNPDWVVFHKKTATKQVQREIEYLATYKKLLDEGKIDQGRYEWLVNLHHYVKPHG